LPPANFDDWGNVVPSNVNDKIIIPFLDGKNNKDYLSETIMKPTDLGQLKGFKFSSFAIRSQCGYAFKDRDPWGFVNVYFLKHPKNAKQILMVFAYSQESTETQETAKSAEEKIDLLLKSLNF
jgi:hypothetical protein